LHEPGLTCDSSAVCIHTLANSNRQALDSEWRCVRCPLVRSTSLCDGSLADALSLALDNETAHVESGTPGKISNVCVPGHIDHGRNRAQRYVDSHDDSNRACCAFGYSPSPESPLPSDIAAASGYFGLFQRPRH